MSNREYCSRRLKLLHLNRGDIHLTLHFVDDIIGNLLFRLDVHATDLLIKVKWKFQNIEFEKKGIRNQAAEQFKIERAAGQGGIWYRFRPVSVCLDKQLPRRNKYAGTC